MNLALQSDDPTIPANCAAREMPVWDVEEEQQPGGGDGEYGKAERWDANIPRDSAGLNCKANENQTPRIRSRRWKPESATRVSCRRIFAICYTRTRNREIVYEDAIAFYAKKKDPARRSVEIFLKKEEQSQSRAAGTRSLLSFSRRRFTSHRDG